MYSLTEAAQGLAILLGISTAAHSAPLHDAAEVSRVDAIYIGIGGNSGTESSVQTILPVARAFTTFSCRISQSLSYNVTLTLRVNTSSEPSPCVIPAGSTSSTVSGTWNIAAGSLVAIRIARSSGNSSGSSTRAAAWGLGN